MCLILFAYRMHPYYRLILAANRDEFYDRPSMPAAFWEDEPQILAGRDLKEGGTWLGITREGRFAAITNYRDPAAIRIGAPSRGRLVKDFLSGRESAVSYINKISGNSENYNGFNLLCGDNENLFVYSNRGEAQSIEAGVYGLSNRFLDSPWPKVVRGKKALAGAIKKKGSFLEGSLFRILTDRKVAPDDQLPSTGIGLDWERLLSSIFIQSPTYGTRSCAILLMGKNRRVKFVERVFDREREPWIESRFAFSCNTGGR